MHLIHNSEKAKYCPNLTTCTYLEIFPGWNLKASQILQRDLMEKKKKKSDWIAAGPNLLDMKGSCKFDSRNSVWKHLSENLFDVGHINEKL